MEVKQSPSVGTEQQNQDQNQNQVQQENKEALMNRVRGALWGAYIGDSLSMPVHWYYNPLDIVRDFGKIVEFQAPKEKHPSSIMHISNTGGHGRGSTEGNIIGGVILKGKKKYWGVPNMHYHQGMKAGENTLNAHCLRLVTRCMAQQRGVYSPDVFLDEYVKFMTTPDTHNDTYAESFHRDFFLNWSQGIEPKKCAGVEGHNTAQIGGLVMLPPVILAQADRPTAISKAVEHLRLTHTSPKLDEYARVYAGMLWDLVHGKPSEEIATTVNNNLKLGLDHYWKKFEASEKSKNKKKVESGNDKKENANNELENEIDSDRWKNDEEVIGGRYSSACYIDGSFACTVYLLGRYPRSFSNAVLSNTNCGGENCHRGAVVGSLLGAAVGVEGIPKRYIEGLAAREEISKEIESYIEQIFQSSNSTPPNKL